MTSGTVKQALLVLPSASDDATAISIDVRRSLARGDVSDLSDRQERLTWISQLIGAAAPGEGLAALRLWGQTGQRPSAWVAGADPVYLEPRLDHLILHHLSDAALPQEDMAETFATLTAAFPEDFKFIYHGALGYVYTVAGTLRLPSTSPQTVDGCEPSPHMPAGSGAEGYQRLQSEIQMTLHQSPVQERRELRQLPPLNALWLWGGGEVPEFAPQPLPDLFTDDPLLHGYWLNAESQVSSWPGSISRCLELADEGFVATLPLADSEGPADLESLLADAIECVRRGHIGELTCLFADGIAVRLRKNHRLRFWKRGDLPLKHASLPARRAR